MEIQEFINRAKIIRDKYAKIEIKNSGKSWTALERTKGLIIDIDDLMKLVESKFGNQNVKDLDKKLSHELSDCLWAILIIADELGIDIEKEFTINMDELEKKIEAKK